jgi:AcrR family transcriptional regulator
LVRIVSKRGLDGVTFRSVAAEAGVTHGLASYHFSSRDVMIREALKWATAHALEAVRNAAEPDGEEKFAAYLTRLTAEEPPEAIFQFQLALEALRRPELLPDVRLTYEQYVESTRAYLESFGFESDSDLARLVFAAKDGLVLQQLIYGNAEKTERALDRLYDVLVAYAATNAGNPPARGH